MYVLINTTLQALTKALEIDQEFTASPISFFIVQLFLVIYK